jgi:hypothetical protein
MITESAMYWITRLDSIKYMLEILAIVSGIFAAVSTFAAVVVSVSSCADPCDENKQAAKTLRRCNAYIALAFAVFGSAAARRELAIEGIGTHSPRKTWAAACYNILSDERANGARVEPLIELQRLGGWKKVDSVVHYLNSVSHWGRFVQSRIFGELK